MESDAFRRLKNISFLGAIDYLPCYESHLKKVPRSRAEHSVRVAALACFVAEHRGYSQELTKHLVVAGLLHDIGHPPLSHSVEPYLKQHFGFGHHEMGQMLLKGEPSVGKSLSKILQAELDVDFIDQLIAGQVPQDEGGDLFSSPINIDTIDGILRTLAYHPKVAIQLKPLDVAYASFIQSEKKRFDVLDEFWSLKGLVYKNIINNRDGALADQYSQYYFSVESGVVLDEQSLFDDEVRWKKKFSSLFDNLKSFKTKQHPIFKEAVDIVDRVYYVVNSNDVFERFRSDKTQKQLPIESQNDCKPLQQVCMIV
ncbi:HD domain-containing protein [Marinospirillum sp.]|uniref:HD domain-containing protein n=1 Tax=Marinospirillum sp. TaxID=2183934 RepID=UPI0025C1BAAA|nr:HD domain-containing protein [Marinospirillum sp.]